MPLSVEHWNSLLLNISLASDRLWFYPKFSPREVGTLGKKVPVALPQVLQM
jgi:hypothetical protein